VTTGGPAGGDIGGVVGGGCCVGGCCGAGRAGPVGAVGRGGRITGGGVTKIGTSGPPGRGVGTFGVDGTGGTGTGGVGRGGSGQRPLENHGDPLAQRFGLFGKISGKKGRMSRGGSRSLRGGRRPGPMLISFSCGGSLPCTPSRPRCLSSADCHHSCADVSYLHFLQHRFFFDVACRCCVHRCYVHRRQQRARADRPASSGQCQ
jgi:hypothetical protein